MFRAGTGCPPSLPPVPAERGTVPLSCRSTSCHRWLCTPDPDLTHLIHVPPCPPDDADAVELKQELQSLGDFRHRSPSRSLSVPNRPRPPHPPQRPPPPSKTLLLWAYTPAGNNCTFPATEPMALNHLLPRVRVPTMLLASLGSFLS